MNAVVEMGSDAVKSAESASMGWISRRVDERAAILSDVGAIDCHHLPLHTMTTASVASHDLGTIERQTIETVARQTDGNKSKTARRVGLTRTQLSVRLRRYRIESPGSRAER